MPLSAQQRDQPLPHLYHTAWTIRDGAPADVQALAQTADGFLWVGTLSGLFRFDGVRFDLYEPPASDTLPSVGVSALLPLQDGGLWVGYQFGGVSLIRDGSIRSYGESDGFPRGTVMYLVQDSSGVVWSGGTWGVARLENGHWHTLAPDEGLSGAPVTGMMVDRGGRIWVAADDGLFARAPSAAPVRACRAPRGPRTWASETATSSRKRRMAPSGPRRRSSGSSDSPPLPRASDARASAPRIPDPGIMLIERSGIFWLGHTRTTERRALRGRRPDLAADDPGDVRRHRAGLARGPRRQRVGRHVERAGSFPPHQAEPRRAAGPGDLFRGRAGGFRRRVGRLRPTARSGESAPGHDEFPELPRLVDVAYRDSGRSGLDREPEGPLAIRPRQVRAGAPAGGEEPRHPGGGPGRRGQSVDLHRQERRLSEGRRAAGRHSPAATISHGSRRWS